MFYVCHIFSFYFLMNVGANIVFCYDYIYVSLFFALLYTHFVPEILFLMLKEVNVIAICVMVGNAGFSWKIRHLNR